MTNDKTVRDADACDEHGSVGFMSEASFDPGRLARVTFDPDRRVVSGGKHDAALCKPTMNGVRCNSSVPVGKTAREPCNGVGTDVGLPANFGANENFHGWCSHGHMHHACFYHHGKWPGTGNISPRY